MKIEVSSDRPISSEEVAKVAAAVESGLARFRERLTRGEVHLKNVDESRGAGLKDCTLEVRPASRDPVVVSDQAPSVDQAVKGAVDKMRRLLDSTFGRLDSKSGGPSASGQPT